LLKLWIFGPRKETKEEKKKNCKRKEENGPDFSHQTGPFFPRPSAAARSACMRSDPELRSNSVFPHRLQLPSATTHLSFSPPHA